MKHIFLSYAREDADKATRLSHILKRYGLPIWIDLENLNPGQDWEYEIRKSIRNCSYFILLLSSNSVTKKGYFQKEIKQAIDICIEYPPGEIFIIPVRLEPCEPSYEPIRRLHWVDFFPSWDIGLQKLIKVVSPEEKNKLQMSKQSDIESSPTYILQKGISEQIKNSMGLFQVISEQFRLSAMVQRDFLPSSLPSNDQLQWSTLYMPAEWLSGDIYDVTRLDENHICFYLADVVGHGMPAALLTIFLKQALVMCETYGSSYKIFSPSEAMTKLNKKMAAQKLSGYQFATCCYCLLNTKTLELTYARAGHPYPILIRQNREPKQLEERGSLLGVFEHAEYSESTIQLQSGDKIVIYSDGAEDIIGSYEKSFGFQYKQKFKELCKLPINELIEQIGNEINVQEFSYETNDDVTIVGVEVK